MPSALTLPNLLTLGRIGAIPIICVLIVLGDPTLRVIALMLYVLAAITDWLDGYLARRMKLGSALGRMLDPIADKLLVAALLIVLAFTRDLSALDLVPAIAIMMREVLVSGMREFLGPRNVVLHVTPLAKWKTTLQLVALGVVIAAPLHPVLVPAGSALLWIAGVLTAWTGIDYTRKALPHFGEARR